MRFNSNTLKWSSFHSGFRTRRAFVTTGASTKGADATAYQSLPCLGSPQVTRLSSRVDKIMLKEAALLFFAGDFRNCISLGGSFDQKTFFWLSLVAAGWHWRLLTLCLSSDVSCSTACAYPYLLWSLTFASVESVDLIIFRAELHFSSNSKWKIKVLVNVFSPTVHLRK